MVFAFIMGLIFTAIGWIFIASKVKDDDFVIAFIGVLFILFGFGIVVSNTGDQTDYKKEAINKGYAEYVVSDKESGATQFRWKTIKEVKK